jgi:glycosyltransferase involved in cell wall biosynthesis
MKVLYFTCLTSKKEKYDGERIKNTLIYNSLKRIADVDVVDFTKNTFINLLKTIWLSMFRKKKYDFFIISKDPHGANVIQKILNFSKVPSKKTIYFEIGPFLYDRILNGSIKKETFINERLIIVETKSMKSELESIGFNRLDVFPNFKEIYDILFNEKKYPKKTLKLIYFSRIEDKKGIYDLVDCIKAINNDDIKFSLDIYGRPQNKFEQDRIIDLCKECPYLEYKGKIDMNNAEAYKLLSEYDLHVFPTKYAEGFPGTIIDFFIAGVPTLASSFARANDILTTSDSIIFKQGDNNDLISKLKDIYDNQSKLIDLRKKSFERKKEYSIEAFDNYLKNMFDVLLLEDALK